MKCILNSHKNARSIAEITAQQRVLARKCIEAEWPISTIAAEVQLPAMEIIAIADKIGYQIVNGRCIAINWQQICRRNRVVGNETVLD